MTAISIRMDKLAAAHHQRAHRKGDYLTQFIEDVRVMLQKIDGQAELRLIPGEGLYWEMTRRMETAAGYSLALMPGDTLKEKRENVAKAYYGKLAVSPEARHAAKEYFALYEGL